MERGKLIAVVVVVFECRRRRKSHQDNARNDQTTKLRPINILVLSAQRFFSSLFKMYVVLSVSRRPSSCLSVYPFIYQRPFVFPLSYLSLFIFFPLSVIASARHRRHCHCRHCHCHRLRRRRHRSHSRRRLRRRIRHSQSRCLLVCLSTYIYPSIIISRLFPCRCKHFSVCRSYPPIFCSQEKRSIISVL